MVDIIQPAFSFLLVVGLLLCFIGVPVFLTIVNIYNLFAKKKRLIHMSISTTMLLGPCFTIMMYLMYGFKDWQVQLELQYGEKALHAPISWEHMPTIFLLVTLAAVGFWLLYTKRFSLPPFVIILSIASIYIGCGLWVTWIIQLLPHINGISLGSPIERYLFCLFPLNFIILSIMLIFDLAWHTDEYTASEKPSRLAWLEKIVKSGVCLPFVAFIAVLPLLGICIAVLVLFGQQPDSVVRAFTETSDWMLSTKVSPEPVYYHGHYLCTVAAGGHPKVVKPKRMGIRHGHRIIVNRQLLIANAFEDLILERAPRFHRWIRFVYDKYGYPVSKHIKSPLAADLTYFIMKPLEWLFLAVLYLFDIHPENRIARQYLP